MKNKEQTLYKIEQAIEQLRPFMHEDGGDMEFIELTDSGIVKVKLLCIEYRINFCAFVDDILQR